MSHSKWLDREQRLNAGRACFGRHLSEKTICLSRFITNSFFGVFVMAEYNINSQYTLLERAKGTIDGKRILPILDVMNLMGVQNFLKDVPYMPANMGLVHKLVRTTSHPASSRRAFYEGVTPTDLATAEVLEPLILFEQWSSVDEQHVETVENGKEVRASRDRIKIAAVLEDFVKAIFTDARTSGAKYIDGLAARLGTLSYPGHTTETLPYCWDGGSSTSTNSSIYIVDWGPEKCYALYPGASAAKGGVLGVNAVDLGKQTVVTSTDPLTVYRAYQSQFTKWAGLAMSDDRCFCRIANIETVTTLTTGRFDEDVLIRALRHGKFNTSTTRIYMNPFLASDVDIRAKDKISGWTTVQVFGEEVTAFHGIPIRVLDEAILGNAEAAVT